MIEYKVKEIRYIDFSSNEKKETREIIIVKKYNDNRVFWVPSPLTDFIRIQHINDSNNTKFKSALVICNFINYINNQLEKGEDELFFELKNRGLFGLEIKHLAKYLNYLSNESKRYNSINTVKAKEIILLNFYDFLYRKGITDSETQLNKRVEISNSGLSLNKSYKNKKFKYIKISPFKDKIMYPIKYPLKNNKNKNQLKDMDEEIWNLFLEYAEEFFPSIALGIYFQIMGGLRAGEVVNLLITDVKPNKDKDYILVDIFDRQEELFYYRGIKTLKSQVKRVRMNQPVFNFNSELFNVYERHIKNLLNKKSRKNLKALFIDSRGESMTGEVYIKEFEKLKNSFIDFIETRSPSTANLLDNNTWGTHIGRHIFTNYLIKKKLINDSTGSASSKLLMIVRGDGSEISSSEYIDSKSIAEAISQNINIISKIAKEIK